jgi:hypothetical protein
MSVTFWSSLSLIDETSDNDTSQILTRIVELQDKWLFDFMKGKDIHH